VAIRVAGECFSSGDDDPVKADSRYQFFNLPTVTDIVQPDQRGLVRGGTRF